MKVGIFSDIHGNIYSFREILKSIKKDGVDCCIFGGDICGYYYHQNEIIDILRGMNNIFSIKGNHDEIFLKTLVDDQLKEFYIGKFGRSYELLIDSISKRNLEYLKDLPETIMLGEFNIAVYHGSPWDHLDGYIYPTDPVNKFRNLPFKYIILGHTHYPMHRIIGDRHILNPGSCGQPRDSLNPSYLILDTEKDKSEIKRVFYDTKPLKDEIRGYGEKNHYLVEVLERNK